MPQFEIGWRRLQHALFDGHLGEVMSFLVSSTGLDAPTMMRCVDETWRRVSATGGGDSNGVSGLSYEHSHKDCLRMRLARSSQMTFR
jgi:hypothetical protein